MHYANGREAKTGDPVIVKEGNKVLAGVIHSLNEGSSSCNGMVSYPIYGGTSQIYVTVGQCYHAADALDAITPKVDVMVPQTPPDSQAPQAVGAPITTS